MQALIVIDMQKDFMPGGPLGTPGADALPPLINQLIEKFSPVLATKDWHPKDHISFAVNHKGKKVGNTALVGKIEQILWPVHCVKETEGAEFAEGLNTEKIEAIFYKGIDPKIDSYSAFFDNAHLRKTDLEDYLRKRGIQEVTLVGVATDYCVFYSALDALNLGFHVNVVRDGCRAINLHPDDEKKALAEMKRKGVKIIFSEEIL